MKRGVFLPNFNKADVEDDDGTMDEVQMDLSDLSAQWIHAVQIRGDGMVEVEFIRPANQRMTEAEFMERFGSAQLSPAMTEGRSAFFAARSGPRDHLAELRKNHADVKAARLKAKAEAEGNRGPS